MGWRKTGNFHAPQEILVMTCDVCERDIGHEDGRRPQLHYEIKRMPNAGAMNEQDPPTMVCSAACLRAFGAKVSGIAPVPTRDAPSPPEKR